METLRLWLGPVVAAATIILGGIGSYYSVQARIFEEIESVGSRSREMVAEMKQDAVVTQAALRETVLGLDMAVRGLTAAVGELKADFRESKSALADVERDVVRLQAENGGSSQRRR